MVVFSEEALCSIAALIRGSTLGTDTSPKLKIPKIPNLVRTSSGVTSRYTPKTMRIWTVHIESFIFCCCRPLNSQNEAQEVSEKLKTVDGNPKIAHPEICPAAATVIDPLKLLLALTGAHNLGAQPQPLSHPSHPGPQLCGIFRV